MCVAPLAFHHLYILLYIIYYYYYRIHRRIRNHWWSQIKQDCHWIERTIEQVRCHQSSIRCTCPRNRKVGCESFAISSVRSHYSVYHIRNHDPRRGTSQKDGRKNSWLFLLRSLFVSIHSFISINEHNKQDTDRLIMHCCSITYSMKRFFRLIIIIHHNTPLPSFRHILTLPPIKPTYIALAMYCLICKVITM